MSTPTNDEPYQSQPQPAYQPPYPAYQPYVPPPVQNSGFAVTAMVLGISGVVVSWFTFGIPSLLAVIFGAIAFKQTGHGGRSGRGFAITGLVLGIVMLALGVWVSAVLIYGVGSSINQACTDGTLDCS